MNTEDLRRRASHGPLTRALMAQPQPRKLDQRRRARRGREYAANEVWLSMLFSNGRPDL